MQKYSSICKRFSICLLLFSGVISYGQTVDFVDTLFTKRLNSINLHMELPYNDVVEANIRILTHQQIQYAAKSLYAFFAEREYIDSMLKTAGLPKELAYIPLALTQMNPFSENKTAAGVWQLPYLLAVAYGLTVTNEIDERRDIKKSTPAAIAYLKKLSEQYEDVWELIIAYSNSASALEAAKIRTNQSKNVWDLYAFGNLPNKRIIPDFITYVYLANFYQSHHIKPVMPDWNKEIIPRNAVENNAKPVVTTVQTKPLSMENTKNVAVGKKQEPKKTIYTIKSGDTLTKIAKIHHVSINDIKKWNNLKSDRINAGEKLVIYRF